LYRHRFSSGEPSGQGAFWMRILLLGGALVALIVLRASCSTGVVRVFEQVAPPIAPGAAPAGATPASAPRGAAGQPGLPGSPPPASAAGASGGGDPATSAAAPTGAPAPAAPSSGGSPQGVVK
jgi:hypothetical protein